MAIIMKCLLYDAYVVY